MNTRYENIKITHPHIANEWDYNKNKEINIDNITIGSHKKVYWICKNNHSWLSSVYHRKERGCPYCNGKLAIKGETDAFTLYPNIFKEWDYEKNKNIDIYTLLPHSKTKYYWKCSNNHSYKSSLNKKVIGRGCPYCSNQKVLKGFNDLETINSQLASEWNYDKNDLLPSEVTSSSKIKVWWICKKDKRHIWEDTVNHRNNGRNCPICSNKQIMKGINDLSTTHPELIKDWDFKKNVITPTEISAGSKRDVYWKCHKCQNEWVTKVHVRRDFGCPRCSESKGEKKITTFLNQNGFLYKSQFRISDCRYKKPLPFDFAIFDKNNNLLLLIEYDGIQHFKTLNFKNKTQNELELNLREVQFRDKIKTDYCLTNNIRLLRISYLQFDNIENILKKELF